MPMAPSSVVREGDSRHHLSERWDHAELLQNQTSYRQKSTRSKLVEISTLVGDQLPELEHERVKFGTFSLGDVMAQEIQKFRRFHSGLNIQKLSTNSPNWISHIRG
jgi:hypothetical protein